MPCWGICNNVLAKKYLIEKEEVLTKNLISLNIIFILAKKVG